MHLCDLGLILGLAVSRFPPSTKTNTSKFQFDLYKDCMFLIVYTVGYLPSVNKLFSTIIIINFVNTIRLFVWFDRPGESSPEKDCCW